MFIYLLQSREFITVALYNKSQWPAKEFLNTNLPHSRYSRMFFSLLNGELLHSS